MLFHFSSNIFKQFGGIVWYNKWPILFFFLMGTVAFICHHVLLMDEIALPVIPVTILGGGLAIFLGFRNNAAYDRWWEARKIWGAIVNSSRSFGTEIMSFVNLTHAEADLTEKDVSSAQRAIIQRQIAWTKVLQLSLRNRNECDQVKPMLELKEYEDMLKAPNKVTFLNHKQGLHLAELRKMGLIEDFRHMELSQLIKDFYDQQGMCERIKKTVFPFYYTYFTSLFLWLFIIILPFALVPTMNYMSIPLCVAISFIFFILDKSGNITESPFENRAADTPMTAISRTIEIDLLAMLGETDLPEPTATEFTKFGAEFLR